MTCGWSGMGNRERAFSIYLAKRFGLERVEGMSRAWYDDARDELGFSGLVGSVRKVYSVEMDWLAASLGMSLAHLQAWIEHDPSPDVLALARNRAGADERLHQAILLEVAPEDVQRTVAEADAMWDALDEC